jgi:hypothetical protein
LTLPATPGPLLGGGRGSWLWGGGLSSPSWHALWQHHRGGVTTWLPPILGVDFLQANKLSVGVESNQLVGDTTGDMFSLIRQPSGHQAAKWFHRLRDAAGEHARTENQARFPRASPPPPRGVQGQLQGSRRHATAPTGGYTPRWPRWGLHLHWEDAALSRSPPGGQEGLQSPPSASDCYPQRTVGPA